MKNTGLKKLMSYCLIMAIIFTMLPINIVRAETTDIKTIIPKKIWYFGSMGGIAVDSNGDLYLADQDNKQIRKFDKDGTCIKKWGSEGTEDGQFKNPQGVAVGPDGNIYVVDGSNNRIQKFSSDGTYVLQWGSEGTGDGQFKNPQGVAVDPDGNVYVVDGSNNRIQKFSSDGTYVLQWGSEGAGNGQLYIPNGIAIDSNGNVYVVDMFNNRIQKFNSDGEYISKWGSSGTGDGQFNYPSGISIDNSGNVYVSETSNNRIQKFNSDGEYISKWGSNGIGDGQFNYPQAITIDSNGNVYVVDGNNNRIQKFNLDGTHITNWGSSGAGDGEFSNPNSVALDSSGNIYVVDGNNNRIQKFNSDGTYVAKWGSKGTEDGQFSFPKGIAIDNSGNVYVLELGNNRVQKFNSDGIYVAKWGSRGTGDGQFDNPRGIAVDSSGNVYISDSVNNRIQKFNSDGIYVSQWGSKGTGDGQFDNPAGVAVDNSGNVYVVDVYNIRIQKFNSDGTYVSQWTREEGIGDGQFKNLDKIAVDSNGNIYISELYTNRIQKFDSNGNFIKSWAGKGTEDGQFSNPAGIAVDSSGNVYVADQVNERIQMITAISTPPTVSTISSTNIIETSATVGGEVTDDGNGSLTVVGVVYGTANNLEVGADGTKTVKVTKPAIGDFTVDITGLTPNTTYHARAYATNEAGTAYGDDISFTTSKLPPPTPAPLSAPKITGQAGDECATIEWNGVSKATGYKIYQDSMTVSDAVYTVSESVYSYYATDLKNGTQYAFKVKAINKAGESVFSNEVKVTPTASPEPPVPTYTVKFNSQGGSTVSDITDISKGASISEPTAPTRSGYTFSGWYKEASCTNQWDFGVDTVTSNTTLYGKWTEKSSGHSSSGGHSRTPSREKEKGIKVIVNGKEQTAGKEVLKEENGKQEVELIVDSKVVNQKIEEVIKDQLKLTDKSKKAVKNIIEVPVSNENADKITTTLTGDMVKNMDQNAFKLAVQSKGIDYIIPAKEIGIEKVASTLGIKTDALKEIKVEVQIQKADQVVVDDMNKSAKQNNYEIVVPPVEFKVVAKTTSKSGKENEVEVSKFNQYVERVMEIPVGVDPNKITTGIVYNLDGTLSHVPTDVFQKENRYFAKVNSLTNSNYSVIWNPITVASVEHHWSKESVNDMASRLIIKNPESFMPNAHITRADFAEYITKAIGVYRTRIAKPDQFSDVKVTDEYGDGITAAVEYGIINGYPDGTFNPNAKVSREEAMTMYARAMDIIQLKGTDEGRIESYTDKDKVSKWAYDAVKKTLSAGVFNGRTNEQMAPKGSLTYAEAATAVRNLLIEAKLINQ